MRTLGGVILGLLLFFPGIVLLQWLTVNVLGIYDAMTLTDGCLVMIIILLCVTLAHLRRPARAVQRQQHTAHSYDEAVPPGRLRYLSGAGAGEEPAPPARRRGSTRRGTRRN